LRKFWRLPSHGIWRHAYSTHPALENETRVDEAQPSLEKRRIHILGIGNIGCLFAHSLARISNRPPVTLLFHRLSLLQDFKKAGETIEIITNDTSNKQYGFDYEVIGAEGPKEQRSEPIYNLILATKATHTLPALTSIGHRLTPHSTILLTQNGLSTTSHLHNLFPTPSQPSFLTSVVFHGIYSDVPFTSIHAGVGFLHLAPTFISSVSPDSFQYLLSTVLTLPAVNAIEATPRELLIIQLEKLVVNAIINPLTALFRIRNGELYDYPALEPLIRSVISETSAVILALPEMRDEQRATRERFGVQVLWGLVKEKALLTRGNRSSMLHDVEERKGETEIGFINGWVVERGRELGVGVRVSEKVVAMVEERRVVRLEEVREVFGL
jgi:2-dehydropantoate 2-reductase